MAATQLHSTTDDRVEHRLHISRRLADHLQDVGGGDLLVKCLGYPRMGLGQRTLLLLQLLEQPHVLDGNDGLVGERLEQRDLLIRELPYLLPAKEERSDRHAFPEKRYSEAGSMPHPQGDLGPQGELDPGAGKILDV